MKSLLWFACLIGLLVASGLIAVEGALRGEHLILMALAFLCGTGAVFGIVYTVLAGALGLWLSSYLTRPLSLLSSTAKSLAAGKWSAREILCHLADCEMVFAFRLRQTLAEDHHVIQPFDQEKWAAQYDCYDTRDALSTFHTVRNWNLALIRSLPPEALETTVTHPERGTITFRTIVETMAGHDINHLRQLEAIVKQYAPENSALSASS